MKNIKIKFDKKKLSSNIKQISLNWSLSFLKKKIKNNINLKLEKKNNIKTIKCVLIDSRSKIFVKFNNLVNLPKKEESYAIIPLDKQFDKIIIYGADTRGIIYAITELADRIENLLSRKKLLDNIFSKTIESPKTSIRSISKCFESNVEDLKWFNDKKMWVEYLDMLITNRFNRLTFTVGMQYNYPYGNEFIKDVYLYCAYPFLIKPKNYKIYAEGLSIKERSNNLKILKFISNEASKRGLEFQLAIWTQRYDFHDAPNANYQIKNIPKKYAEYCRDSLELILKKCPSISGLTLRVHVECGIEERNYKFWETYFEAIQKIKRNINLDLHAKGIDQKLINIALNASSNVSISPKYTAEHMGLPYHQASIRKQEMPPKKIVDKKWTFSEGKRKFLRYSYGDLLTKNRKYEILYRIWPGTQRVLIWGDPDLARGYGQHSTFCNSLGVELCEPLSFKGRMGTGIQNGRFNYLSKNLRTTYDWQKYIYTYKVWGRCTYNYKSNNLNFSRYYSKLFGNSADDLINALSYASKILPLFTLVHGVSASNNSYWPEIYENMSIVEKAPHLPYSYDLQKPSRFGMATSQDPQLIMSPIELANCIHKKISINRYSPITMSNWFADYANKAKKFLSRGLKNYKQSNNPEFKRLEIDIKILSTMGKFFSYKIKSACYWELFLKQKNYELGFRAVRFYEKACKAWSETAEISKKYYLKDLTYGPQSWLRGRWDDRLPAIKEDVIKMKNILRKSIVKKTKLTNNNKILEIKNNQKFKIEHKIYKNNNGELVIKLKQNKKSKDKLLLNYRHVNQSEKWKRRNFSNDEMFFAKISKKYVLSEYPIQYYFEFIKDKYSSFCPGIDKKLGNQPYFIFND